MEKIEILNIGRYVSGFWLSDTYILVNIGWYMVISLIPISISISIPQLKTLEKIKVNGKFMNESKMICWQWWACFCGEVVMVMIQLWWVIMVIQSKLWFGWGDADLWWWLQWRRQQQQWWYKYLSLFGGERWQRIVKVIWSMVQKAVIGTL